MARLIVRLVVRGVQLAKRTHVAATAVYRRPTFSPCHLTLSGPKLLVIVMGTKTTTLKNGTRVTRLVATTPEWRLQASAVRALRALPEFGKRFTLAADMAAGRRGWQTATIAKATGLVKGEADLRLYLEGGRLGLIEYKAAKGRLSPEQKDRGALLARLGFTMQAVVKATSEADAAEQTLSVVGVWLAANDNQPMVADVKEGK